MGKGKFQPIMIRRNFFIYLLVGACCGHSVVFADSLTLRDMLPEGKVLLSTEEVVQLAGIEVSDEEWLSLKPILIGKAVKVEFFKNASADFPVAEVFIYMDQYSVALPVQTDTKAQKNEAMLNRWLLDLGFARVKQEDFSKRDEFLAAESAAQADGKGIWSAESEQTALTEEGKI